MLLRRREGTEGNSASAVLPRVNVFYCVLSERGTVRTTPGELDVHPCVLCFAAASPPQAANPGSAEELAALEPAVFKTFGESAQKVVRGCALRLGGEEKEEGPNALARGLKTQGADAVWRNVAQWGLPGVFGSALPCSLKPLLLDCSGTIQADSLRHFSGPPPPPRRRWRNAARGTS
ncbi:unnamed protein product [Pleuronectes platessa]|uniref:Uncharacterized protein n=1 Tax=Pleuronectes platessa TaxID=8262 RepID=A0A9N7VDA7_PLEPL|nr:unnamed protein product [Pleuronectes platessa]